MAGETDNNGNTPKPAWMRQMPYELPKNPATIRLYHVAPMDGVRTILTEGFADSTVSVPISVPAPAGEPYVMNNDHCGVLFTEQTEHPIWADRYPGLAMDVPGISATHGVVVIEVRLSATKCVFNDPSVGSNFALWIVPADKASGPGATFFPLGISQAFAEAISRMKQARRDIFDVVAESGSFEALMQRPLTGEEVARLPDPPPPPLADPGE